MSTNSLWTDIKKNYFKSADIKIFPSVDRDLTFDRESRLNTEYNFTKMSNGGFSNRDSYIKSWKDDDTQVQKTLKCNIAGYHFDINTIDYTELLVANKYTYLVVEIHTATIATNENDSIQTRTYKIVNQNNNTNTSLDNLEDGAYYFHGLSYIHLDSKEQASLLTHTIDDTLNYNDLTNEINNKFYYLLLIGNNGSKADESFLPEINTLDNGGIKIKDLEIVGEDSSNSGDWIKDHMGTMNAGIKLKSEDNRTYVHLNLESNEIKDKILMTDRSNVANYYPVELVKKSEGGDALGVGIPIEDITYRAIHVNGEQFLSKANLNYLNIAAEESSNVSIETDSNTRTIYFKANDTYVTPTNYGKSGLKIAENLSRNIAIHVPYADKNTGGISKVYDINSSGITVNQYSKKSAGDYYGIEKDANDRLFVYIPLNDLKATLNASIENLNSRVKLLEENGVGELVECYSSTPYSKLLTDDDVETSYLNAGLATYSFTVYHNKTSSVKQAVITNTAVNGYLSFKQVSAGTNSTLFILGPGNVSAETGENIEEIIKTNILYYDNLGEVIGTFEFTTNVTLSYEKPASYDCYSQTPEVKFWHELADDEFSGNVTKDNLENFRIRLYHYANSDAKVSDVKVTPYILGTDGNGQIEEGKDGSFKYYSLEPENEYSESSDYITFKLSTGQYDFDITIEELAFAFEIQYVANGNINENTQHILWTNCNKTIKFNMLEPAPEFYWDILDFNWKISAGSNSILSSDFVRTGNGTEGNPYIWKEEVWHTGISPSSLTSVEFNPGTDSSMTVAFTLGGDWIEKDGTDKGQSWDNCGVEVVDQYILSSGSGITRNYDFYITYRHSASDSYKTMFGQIKLNYQKVADPGTSD